MKKLKKDNIAIIIAIVLVLVYIFYECYSVTHVGLQTQTAVTSVVYEAIDTEALILRDEHTINSATSGITVPCFSDGDKINVGGNVAMTFSNTQNAESYSEYLQLEKQIEYYEELESQSTGHTVDLESINDEIDDDVNEYIRAINNDVSDVQESGENLNDSLIRRQLIIGEDIDFTSILQDLRSKAEAMSVTSPQSYITTDESGVFSSYTDGFEDIYDYSEIENITADEINSCLEKIKNPVDTTDKIGKLVTSYDWYMVSVVSADSVSKISNGSKLDVALKDNDDLVLKAEVVSGAEPAVGAEETVLILKCNNMDSTLSSLRSENIEIRYDEHEGIKVPVDAVHVVDGKKGVYALISSQVSFREADVIYTADDYVLLSYDADNDNGIRLYDKIITQGKELEDGKVYT